MIIFISFLLSVLGMIGVIAVLILVYILDSSYGIKCVEIGKLNSKVFIPEHTETHYDVASKMILPKSVNHPDSWEVIVELNDNKHTTKLTSKNVADTIEVGDMLIVTYRKGRIFDSVTINEIEKYEG